MTFMDVVLIAALNALADTWPLSADGHFALAPGLSQSPEAFAVVTAAARLGAAAGTALWFWRDFAAMALGGVKMVKGKIDPGGRLLLIFLAASLPACILYRLIPDFVTLPTSQNAAAFALLGFGAALLIADRLGVTISRIEHMGLPFAALIGGIQAIALLPGASRVGVVVTIARLSGFERRDAARLALLPAIPVLTSQALFGLWDASHSVDLVLSSDLTIAAGLALATAWACAGLLTAWLQRHGFAVFALWRIMIAGGVLALAFLSA